MHEVYRTPSQENKIGGARLWALLVVVLVAALSPSALTTAAPPAGQPGSEGGQAQGAELRRHMGQIAQAHQALIAGEREEALRRLDQVLEQIGQPTAADVAAVHAAALLRGQIRGDFRRRQRVWESRRVADMVVLVPDEATFLETIRQWRGQVYFPILIEDSIYTPMFIRAFEPETVVRRPAVKDEPQGGDADNNAAGVAEALEARIESHNATLREAEAVAPGLVVIDPADPQRMAGFALALGRGQPVQTLDSGGRFHRTASAETVAELNRSTLEAMNQWRILSLDSWCGLTLAGEFPYRYRAEDVDERPVRATADAIGRNPAGVRMAVVGHLTGSPAQSVYQAMSSLFLQPRSALVFDAYPSRGNLSAYRMDRAAEVLGGVLDSVDFKADDKATVYRFREATGPINPYDMLWLNSSGGSAVWNVRGDGHATDMPIGRPVAMHMVHSFSAQQPHRVHTLAGRAIAGGAFWYYGSANEPYLHGFTHPNAVAEMFARGTPLAFAARRRPVEPAYEPWMLTLIGDPLYALHPDRPPRVRVQVGDDLAALSLPAPERASAAERLRLTAMLDRAEAIEPALQVLEAAADEDVEDVILAAMLALDHDRAEAVCELGAEVILRHDLLRTLAAEVLIRRVTSAAQDGRPRDVADEAVTLAIVHPHVRHMSDTLERWYREMIREGHGDTATTVFNRILDDDRVDGSRREAVEALKQ